MNEFDQIIGYDSIKAEMIRFCDVLKNSEKYEKDTVREQKLSTSVTEEAAFNRAAFLVDTLFQ